MDRTWLHEQLTAGRSIESLAREVGRDPSTVAYWVAKYGLASTHAPKHAARGGIAREQLESLIAEGLSIRAIGKQLGVSYATVQHWLKKHGLETARARRRRQTPRPGKNGAPTARASATPTARPRSAGEPTGTTAASRAAPTRSSSVAARSSACSSTRPGVPVGSAGTTARWPLCSSTILIQVRRRSPCPVGA
jgi:transposase-like protein